jgi:hypothetical protein
VPQYVRLGSLPGRGMPVPTGTGAFGVVVTDILTLAELRAESPWVVYTYLYFQIYDKYAV